MEKDTKDKILYITSFGNFQITGMGGEAGQEHRMPKMLVKLLIYFLTNDKRSVSIRELIDAIYPEGKDILDPVSSVRNLMWRLRNELKKVWGADGEKFIITRGSDYIWNQEFKISMDSRDFEMYVNRAQTETDLEKKIENLATACGLYKGSFMRGHDDVMWIAYRATYFHTLYLKTVKELAALFYETGRFFDMERLTEDALREENLDEELYCWYIRSLMGQGNFKTALAEYKKSQEVLYAELGVNDLPLMQEVYEELMKENHNREDNISAIVQSLRSDMGEGAFYCEYGVFKQIFQLEMRRSERLGISVYLSLVSINLEVTDKSLSEEESNKLLVKGMKRLKEVIVRSLRTGDVVSRYSNTQFLLLLPTCQYETATRVMERIERIYKNKMKSSQLRLAYNMDEMI